MQLFLLVCRIVFATASTRIEIKLTEFVDEYHESTKVSRCPKQFIEYLIIHGINSPKRLNEGTDGEISIIEVQLMSISMQTVGVTSAATQANQVIYDFILYAIIGGGPSWCYAFVNYLCTKKVIVDNTKLTANWDHKDVNIEIRRIHEC